MTAVSGRPVGWSTARVEGVLRAFIDAGAVGPFETHLVVAAERAAVSTGETVSDGALLALALAARATRLGHVRLELDHVHRQVAASLSDEGTDVELPYPHPDAWLRELAGSPLVAEEPAASLAPLRPLVLVGNRVYLQRYWSYEVAVAGQLQARSAAGPGSDSAPESTVLDELLDTVFGPPDGADPSGGPNLQREAVRRALIYPVTVIAGGPGTGKTHTVARLLAAWHLLASRRGVSPRAALAAPTGKAANRMQEALDGRVGELRSSGLIDPAIAASLLDTVPTTVHRLLGARGRSSFDHHRGRPLPFDLIVVDETSMLSLPLLARLVDATRTEARLVLVGDPFQLTSIEAGTVMGDLVGPGDVEPGRPVGPLSGRVSELRRGYRFVSNSGTAALAAAIRTGDGDGTIEQLSVGDPDVRWVRPDDRAGTEALDELVVESARRVVSAAVEGRGPDALIAAQEVKVLTAMRRGAGGLDAWTARIADAVIGEVPPNRRGGWPRLGTPVMVTGNDPVNRLANGDVGIVVHEGSDAWVVLGDPERPRRLAPALLGEWEPWWAMTVHKSQGSEFLHAVVSLPSAESPILTRELLYTAVTRARERVTVFGSEEMIRLAVSRPVARASGLRDRLWSGR